jgi:hypothetical protein
MELLILIAIGGLIGFFFARSRYSKHVDTAAQSVSDTSKDYAGKTSSWWRRNVSRSKQAANFSAWVARPGASQLPEEFKDWFSGLSTDEQEKFTYALDGYLSGLGYDLNRLVDGSLDNQFALLQSYVEAVVVYSDAFRKAQEAHNESSDDRSQAENESDPGESKKTAEKSTSRRQSNAKESASAA